MVIQLVNEKVSYHGSIAVTIPLGILFKDVRTNYSISLKSNGNGQFLWIIWWLKVYMRIIITPNTAILLLEVSNQKKLYNLAKRNSVMKT